jgi:hypothetical protein
MLAASLPDFIPLSNSVPSPQRDYFNRLLTDYFIATPTDIAECDFEESPSSRFPTFCAKRTDVVKLLGLQSLLSGISTETLLKSLDELVIPSPSPEEGPWVFRVPEDVVSALSTASPQDLTRLASEWANTEEWKLDGGTPDNIGELLVGLSGLFRRAKSEGKNAYLWACL